MVGVFSFPFQLPFGGWIALSVVVPVALAFPKLGMGFYPCRRSFSSGYLVFVRSRRLAKSLDSHVVFPLACRFFIVSPIAFLLNTVWALLTRNLYRQQGADSANPVDYLPKKS
jgi:hypothetical protein